VEGAREEPRAVAGDVRVDLCRGFGQQAEPPVFVGADDDDGGDDEGDAGDAGCCVPEEFADVK